FTTQPIVQTFDAYGNLSTVGLASSVTVTIAKASGPAAILQGTTSYDIGTGAGNGMITGSGLRLDKIGSSTLNASAAGFTAAVSSLFTVTPTTATVLSFSTSPSGATAGSPFGAQPVVQTLDAFGNPSTVGLVSSVTVTITRVGGPSATLQGTTSYDIGTGVGNGTITGSGLRLDTV